MPHLPQWFRLTDVAIWGAGLAFVLGVIDSRLGSRGTGPTAGRKLT